MGFWFNRIRIRRQGAVLQVAATTVLVATACGRTDAVPAETPAEVLHEVPGNVSVAAAVDLEEPRRPSNPPDTIDGWCVDGTEESLAFMLENGKTVSIDLIYTYGVLGEEPELVYSGSLLRTLEGLVLIDKTKG